MSVEKIRGIVLKEYNAGESSKRIVVLSREKGKVVLSVNGGKNTKSKYLAAAQLFCYSEFVVFKGKGFYSVTQAEIIESFHLLSQDIVKLSYGAYILELTEKTMLAEMVDEGLLDLILRTFSLIARSDYSVPLAVSVFEVKYLQRMGLFGQSRLCGRCGTEVLHGAYFSPKEGILCGACQKAAYGTRPILGGTLAALNHILENEDKKLFAFKVSPAVEKELREILELYVSVQLEQRFATLDFAKQCAE